jgi:hypothetical protein
MKKSILIFLLFILAVTLNIMTIAYCQTPKKTVTMASGEVVCDLNGEWSALYAHYGPMQSIGEIKSAMKITQQGNVFVGISLMTTGYTSAGTEKIRGELDKNGIKKAQYSIPFSGWVDAKGEISEDGDKIVFDTGQGVKVILERK